MPYRTRGVFAGDESVDPETARTEVLAKAFNDVAGEYFERENEYEQGIEENREKMQSLRLVVGASVVVGLVIALVGRSLLSVGIGVVATLAGVLYSYVTYIRLKDEIKQYEEHKAINSPDGSIYDVTQVGVPFYLVPFDDQYLVFDGLGQTPDNEIELAHLDTDRLTDQQAELADLVDVYDEYIEGTNVASPEYLEEILPDAATHRELERPLADKIDEMRATVKHPETETRSVTAHGTNAVAESVASLSANDELLELDHIPEVTTDPSRAVWDQSVAAARGLRHDALDEETLAPIRESNHRARELTDPAVERLDDNVDSVETHYEAHSDLIDETTNKQTCQECLLERCERLATELSLLDEVLGAQTGEFGATLDDPDLQEVAADGGVTAQDQLHDEIDSNLPSASEELRKAYNSLPDLGDDGFCPEHGETELVSVPEDGLLFGAVWRCLYDEFREGVLETADDLVAAAAERREQKEKNMVNLAQYEGISDLLEREYRSVEAQEATAEKIDRVFDRLETQLVEVEPETQPVETPSKQEDESQGYLGSLWSTAPLVETPSKQEDESQEEFKQRLESRLEHKKEQVRQTKQEVLESYSDDVGTLTDEFLGEIPDGKPAIDAVDDEFRRFWDHRKQLVTKTAAHGDVVTDNYEQRLATLEDSRSAYETAVSEFLDRRQATADAATGLGTPVEQADRFDRIVVSFWVVFVEQEGVDDFLVYPILGRTEPSERPSPDQPYAEHLAPHSVHDYEQFVDSVREQLADSELLDSIRPEGDVVDRREDGRFADTSVLRTNDAIDDTFVDELQRYEL